MGRSWGKEPELTPLYGAGVLNKLRVFNCWAIAPPYCAITNMQIADCGKIYKNGGAMWENTVSKTCYSSELIRAFELKSNQHLDLCLESAVQIKNSEAGSDMAKSVA